MFTDVVETVRVNRLILPGNGDTSRNKLKGVEGVLCGVQVDSSRREELLKIQDSLTINCMQIRTAS